MIPCPQCKGETRCTGSAKWIEEQGYLRGRKCISCGYKFKTVEVIDSDYNILIGIHDSVEGIVRRVLKDLSETTPDKNEHE